MGFLFWIRERVLNPVWANIESAFWGRTPAGDVLFNELRSKAPDVHIIAGLLNSKGFVWKADPAGGNLDYHSFPRVTCARKKGDCDDYAFLWEELLRGYGECWIMYTYTKDEGHAMCVFKSAQSGGYYLFSNIQVYATAFSRDNFDKLFFGDKTTETKYFKP